MTWKQQLLKTRAVWFLNHYSAARDHGIPAPASYQDRTAAGLRRCVLDLLKYEGCYTNAIPGNSRTIHAIINKQYIILELCGSKPVKLTHAELKELQIIKSKCKVYFQVTDMGSFTSWYNEFVSLSELTKSTH